MQLGFSVAMVERQVSEEGVVNRIADVTRQMEACRQYLCAVRSTFDRHDALHRMI